MIKKTAQIVLLFASTLLVIECALGDEADHIYLLGKYDSHRLGDPTFNLLGRHYKKFIQDVVDSAKDPNRMSHTLPVLPRPPDAQHQIPVEYLDIELQGSSGLTLTARLRRHDLYLVGYRMNTTNQWLEFSNNDNTHLIDGSEFLGFGENYNDLGGLETIPRLGYNTLDNAINRLADSTDGNTRRTSLRALAVMICEAARYQRLSNYFDDLVQRQADEDFTESGLPGWMVVLIRGWGDLSDRMLMEDNWRIDFRLPPDGDGNDNILTREAAIHNVADAVACLGLLKGNFPYPPPPSLGLRFIRPPYDHGVAAATSTISTGSSALQEGSGQSLVEVFSVRIINIDGENPGDLYGIVKVTDGLGSFYIYNRARSDYESIHPDDTATLTGPYRSISFSRFFRVDLDLMDKDNDVSPDDEISKGSFSWDIFALGTNPEYYEKRLFQAVSGKHGSVFVYYTIFRDAVQAKVEVVLINGDGEDPAHVFGTLVARYTNYDYSTEGQKKYYQTVLFNQPADKYVEITPNSLIPLARYMVAVPITSSLVVEADLWDYDNVSPNDEIAKGIAIFLPQPHGQTEEHDITGRYGSIRVKVTWSQLSG